MPSISHHPTALDPRRFTPGVLSQLLVCNCGAAWNVTRTATHHHITEHINCLCGETLLQWSECADYIVQPMDMDEPMAN